MENFNDEIIILYNKISNTKHNIIPVDLQNSLKEK
jgi:hypothetical protein